MIHDSDHARRYSYDAHLRTPLPARPVAVDHQQQLIAAAGYLRISASAGPWLRLRAKSASNPHENVELRSAPPGFVTCLLVFICGSAALGTL